MKRKITIHHFWNSTKPRKVNAIGTIKQEKAACIRAFRKYPKAKYAWCLHHRVLSDRIKNSLDYWDTPDWKGRIAHVLKTKPIREMARRFRNFRPVKPGARKPYSENQLHRQWPNNTWNGRSIF